MFNLDKKELLALSKRLNKKHPDVKAGFKAKLIQKNASGEKKEVWYVKTETIQERISLWIPDRYKAGIKYGKEISYLGYNDNY